MPEGDTIFRAARALNTALAGRVVTGFETAYAKLARVNDDTPVVGRVVERVVSHGKWLLIYFSGDLILITHMLMSGSWHIYRAGERWRMARSKMRVMVRTDEWEAVLFNAQVAEFHTARSLERCGQVPKLGQDLLAEEFTVDSGVARLKAYARDNPDAEVGVVLLNQRVIAGLGNVYKSEVAFAAGVNPWRQMRTVTRAEMERIVEFSLRYMKANVVDGKGDGIVTYVGIRRTTTSMNKEERLWVYGRQGQECRRCGAVVMMRKQGEQARVTYWCPECQRWVGEGAVPVGDVAAGRRRKASC
jgi:endonuclease VIII